MLKFYINFNILFYVLSNVVFYETSAKSSASIDELFITLGNTAKIILIFICDGYFEG